MKVLAVVGNPKKRSRTAEAALELGRSLSGVEPALVDIADFGDRLLGWGDDVARQKVGLVAGADLVIFASPTFKATYSGLLKLFLDQFDTATGLANVVGVPMMMGAGPAHALAPELLLKPVLVELGAICPAPGLYLPEAPEAQAPVRAAWLDRWAGPIRTLLADPARRKGSS